MLKKKKDSPFYFSNYPYFLFLILFYKTFPSLFKKIKNKVIEPPFVKKLKNNKRKIKKYTLFTNPIKTPLCKKEYRLIKNNHLPISSEAEGRFKKPSAIRPFFFFCFNRKGHFKKKNIKTNKEGYIKNFTLFSLFFFIFFFLFVSKIPFNMVPFMQNLMFDTNKTKVAGKRERSSEGFENA